jgi:hypothetical protein
MRVSKIILIILILFTFNLSECKSSWIEKQLPTTQYEKDCVSKMTAQIIILSPYRLEGDFKDWNKSISTCNDIAIKTCCEIKLYEVDYNGYYTGNIRSFNEIKENK